MRVEALPNGVSIAKTVAWLAGSCALAAIVMAKVFGATLVSGKDRFPASTQGSSADVVSIAAYLVRSRDLGRAALWLGTFGLVWSIAALIALAFGGSLP